MLDVVLSGRRLARQDNVLEDICFFAEQLEEIVELERSGQDPKQRIALVALDSLAEVILYRHAISHFEASEGTAWWRQDGYPQARRRTILRDFGRKVTLGEKRVEGLMTFHYPEPVLDSFDATVFRIAHRHRNAVHHRGDHNKTLLGPLTRLYAQSVGRAFGRSVRRGWAMGGLSNQRLEPLVKLGWEPEASGFVSPETAARQIMGRICGAVEVDHASFCTRLQEDLEKRAEAVDGQLDALRRDGLDDTYLAGMLRAAQLRAAHSADEALVRLRDQETGLMQGLMATENPTDDDYQVVATVKQAQTERIIELDADFKQVVGLKTSGQIRRKAQRLSGAKDVTALVKRYQPLDGQLDLLAGTVEAVVSDWDREVQDEIDRRRGK